MFTVEWIFAKILLLRSRTTDVYGTVVVEGKRQLTLINYRPVLRRQYTLALRAVIVRQVMWDAILSYSSRSKRLCRGDRELNCKRRLMQESIGMPSNSSLSIPLSKTLMNFIKSKNC